MLKGNPRLEARMKCLQEGVSQVELAKRLGTTGPYVNRMLNQSPHLVNPTFVRLMEELGYDVRLVFEKRGEEKAD